MSDADFQTRIVLVGGGYVSVLAYRSLVKRLRKRVRSGEISIVVVCPVTCHQFHGWSSEVLQGIIAPEHHLTSLRELMPLASFVPGLVVAVDVRSRQLTVELNQALGPATLSYDYLLLGTGSAEDDGSIPGLREHGLRLKQTDGMSCLRSQLQNVVELAGSVRDPRLRDELLSIVFAGGGYMGVELCGAVAELLQVWRQTHRVLKEHPPKIHLVHGSAQLLSNLDPKLKGLGEYAQRELGKYGVEVILSTRVRAIREHAVELDSGREIRARTIVSTIGQRCHVLAGTESFTRSRDGRLVADSTLRIQGDDRVWAAGDAAYVEHPRSGGPCPAIAFWAIRHGEHAGHNIARAILGEPLRPLNVFPLGEAASLGVGKGIAELNGIYVVGRLAWLNRILFFLYFMPSWRQAFRVMVDWLLFALVGRRRGLMERPVVHLAASRSPTAGATALLSPLKAAKSLASAPTATTSVAIEGP